MNAETACYETKLLLNSQKFDLRYNSMSQNDTSSVPTRFLPLTVSVIVRVRGKLVRLELEVTC